MLSVAGPTFRPLQWTDSAVTLRQENPVLGTPSALDQGSEVRYQGSEDPDSDFVELN